MRGRAEVYLPIEVKHRELYSKILLATRAVKRGFRVTLGRKTDVNEHVLRMPPGVYYGLGTVLNFSPLFADIARKGHVVVVSDEEGLVTHSDDMYLDLKVSADTLRSIDLVFTWGSENSRVIARGRPEAAAKLRTTGNPRFDLLKAPYSRVYDREVADIRRRYPKYVLICTSFGSCNHYIRDLDYVESLIEKKVLTSQASIDIYRRFQDMKSLAWRAFLEAIPLIAARYPDTQFVVRPHPSEHAGPYTELAGAFGNVYVEDGLSIHPWLLAANGVVHHYCTSAVEAFAAGTPGFALRPTRDPQIEKEIPYACSVNCKSPQDLAEALRGTVTSTAARTPMPASTISYSEYVRNINDPIAADLIIEEICRAANANQPDAALHRESPPSRNPARRLRRAVRQAAATLLPSRHASRNYISHKFDRLTVAEVEDVLRAFTPEIRYRCESIGDCMVRIDREEARLRHI